MNGNAGFGAPGSGSSHPEPAKGTDGTRQALYPGLLYTELIYI